MVKSRPIWALGTMSGTALDGVDAALLQTDGRSISAFGETRYRAYGAREQALIRAVLGQWPGAPGVEAAAEMVETAHAVLLKPMTAGADLVGFPGQTLAHAPAERRTHQIGDGQVLADVLRLPVVWDFRSNDVALGGEGAPLAPFFHFACAQFIGASAPLAILNLGGVGNLTWIDPSQSNPEDPGALIAFDTGPGNAPLNDLMTTRRGLPCDADGALAASGTADQSVVAAFLSEKYFYRMPPKSLDRNSFARLSGQVAQLPDADAAATLTACTIAAVARGMEHCPMPPSQLLVSGGGRKNATLMAGLGAALPMPVVPVETVGLDGDMLEAQAFAFLAVRVARGLPTSCPATTGVRAAVGGGILSHPTPD